MEGYSFSEEELRIRSALLNLFNSEDTSGRGIIHAAVFQQCLSRLNLKFGQDIVDRVMLQCSIDPEGNVSTTCVAVALRVSL